MTDKFKFPDTFDARTPDSKGLVFDPKLAGTDVRHTGNGKTYTIMGPVWIGATDEWGFAHQAGLMEPVIVRTLTELYGERAPGIRRYDVPAPKKARG